MHHAVLSGRAWGTRRLRERQDGLSPTPDAAHANTTAVGDGTRLVISEAWTKIDEPMIVPTTSAVAVGSPMPRCKVTRASYTDHWRCSTIPATVKNLLGAVYHRGRVPLSIELLVLVVVGVVSGALNVVAGGGSFLTLPVLLFMGLPATLANGTNRVGVLAQNIGGVLGFHRHGAMNWPWSLKAGIPAIAGAMLGVWAALTIPDFAFRRVLSIAMVVVTVWSLVAQVGAAL